MDTEAAQFRVLLAELFYSLPITYEMPENVRACFGKLQELTYKNGKQSIIDAGNIVQVDVLNMQQNLMAHDNTPNGRRASKEHEA